ncbi:MAG: hypothetical protein FWD97_05890 [Defluviitaleaceae bacterium]|nr:hypothetical protein [Defluviitaleaceae bacterium]
MAKTYRKIILPTLIFITLLSLSGCRYRILYDLADSTPYETSQTQDSPEETTEYPDHTPTDNTTPTPETRSELSTNYETTEYFDANPDNFSPLTMEIEQENAHRYATEEGEEGENPVGTETQQQLSTITVELPAEIEGDVVIGSGSGVVGLIATYSTLLRQGVNTIFPCQLMYIYTETTEDLVTISRGSEIYQMMVNAGGLNVSSRLSADNLSVTTDWVVRRNPDIIVKFVNNTILGNEITNTHSASEALSSIISRPNWGAIEAVQNNRIILLSEQMLELEETRLATKLIISYFMYPELFEGVDIQGAVAELMGDMVGTNIYFTPPAHW